MLWIPTLMLASQVALNADVIHVRVFFAHQSVGENILAGVRELAPALPIVHDGSVLRSPGILEQRVGQNGFALSKLEDFARRVDALSSQIDIAILKFCYDDFSGTTDVGAVARAYQQTMNELGVRHPAIQFVHTTVPLTTTQSGPVAVLKRLAGRPVWGEQENRSRDTFNAWLRRTYPKEHVFDLAEVESRTPAGARVTFRLDGADYPALYAPYSSDGQHLSAEGQRVAATALLKQLHSLSRTRQ